MKTLACAAAALATVIALARADEGAYRSLVGMARAAEAERKPAAPAEPDGADKPAERAADVLDGAASSAPAPDEPLKDALRDALVRGPALAASARPAAAPPSRLWTKLYSTLVPSWRRMPVLRASYDAPSSTATAAALRPLRSLVPPPDSEAVKAGERRGLAELLSSSVAPADAK